MTQDANTQRVAIGAEFSRVEESATLSSQGQFEAHKVWNRTHWLLNGFTALASGVAGVLTFAGGIQIVVGVLALAAAGVAAANATLKPGRRAERARQSAVQYQSVQASARRLRQVATPVDDLPALRVELEDVAAALHQVNESADAIPRFAYLRAKRNIGEGGQSYGVDRE